MKNSCRASESGNVLVYILIAVALIAALSYAVTSGNRNGSGNLNEERAGLIATQILEYADILGNASAQLRLRGCKEYQLNFSGGPAGTYTAIDEPGDNTCHIFNASGGSVNFQDIPDGTSDDPAATWVISGDMGVENIGTSASDLIAFIPDVNEAICIKINELASISDPDTIPEETDATWNTFDGTYSNTDIIGDEATKLATRNAGCFESSTDSAYLFYKVLVTR